MKQTILFPVLLAFCQVIMAQVTINNSNIRPSGFALYIDPAGNTTSISAGGNTSDDVVVLNNGNLGIKNFSPATKLSVNGYVKIVDGSQSNGLVLTSDDNGFASWADASDWQFANDAAINNNNVNYNSGTVWTDITSTSLTLDEGTWLIFARYTAKYSVAGDLSVSWLGLFQTSVTSSNLLTSVCTRPETSENNSCVVYLVYPVEVSTRTDFKVGARVELSTTGATARTTSDSGGSYFYAVQLSGG